MASLIDTLQKSISTDEKITEIRELVNNGVDVNAVKKMGISGHGFTYDSTPTPLTYAIVMDEPIEIIELLLELGGDPYKPYGDAFKSVDGFIGGFFKMKGDKLLELFKLFKKYNHTDLTKRTQTAFSSGVIASIVRRSLGNIDLLTYVLENFQYDLKRDHVGAFNVFTVMLELQKDTDLQFEKTKALIEIGNITGDELPSSLVFTLMDEYYYHAKYLDILKYLIQRGISLKVKDVFGRTPYEHAKYFKNPYSTIEEDQRLYEILAVLRSRSQAHYMTKKRKRNNNNTATILATKKISISSNNIKVFDPSEAEEVSKTIKNISEDKENIYFKAGQSIFSLPRSYLEYKNNIYYECNTNLAGAPYKKDVKLNTPYILLRGPGNYLVRKNELRTDHNLFSVEDTGQQLKYTASRGSILSTYNVGLNGQPVSIVSADHCQEGSERTVFKLVPIEFSLTGVGGRRQQRQRKTQRRLKKKRSAAKA